MLSIRRHNNQHHRARRESRWSNHARVRAPVHAYVRQKPSKVIWPWPYLVVAEGEQARAPQPGSEQGRRGRDV